MPVDRTIDSVNVVNKIRDFKTGPPLGVGSSGPELSVVGWNCLVMGRQLSIDLSRFADPREANGGKVPLFVESNVAQCSVLEAMRGIRLPPVPLHSLA